MIRPYAAALFLLLGAAAPLSFVLDAAPRQAAGAPPPTEAQQQPLFRAGAHFVAVDAYPSRDGRVLSGLTRDDFRVFEDGVEQTVETFEYLAADPFTPEAERRDPGSFREAERLAADPRLRLFVLYLDGQHIDHIDPIETDRKATRPVVEFLRRATGPRDLFGVMTSTMEPRQLTFGRRLEAIESAIASYWERVMRIQRADRTAERPQWLQSDDEVLLSQCWLQEEELRKLVEIVRVEKALENVRGLVARLTELRDYRSHLLLFTGGWVLEGPNPQLRTVRPPPPPGIEVRDGRLTSGASDPGRGADTAVCEAQISRLTELDTRVMFQDLLDFASRGNVSIHTVDLQGLATFDDAGREASSGAGRPGERAPTGFQEAGQRLAALRTLAAETGGVALVGSDDVLARLRGIADGLASFYVLGYYSTNKNFDGAFRKIEVRTRADDAVVAARRGYRAPSADELAALAAEPADTPDANPAFDDALAEIDRMESAAELFAYGVARAGNVVVVTEISERVMGRSVAEGAEVRVELTSDATGASTSARGALPPGLRGLDLALPVEPDDPGPWRAAVVVSSADGPIRDTVSVASSGASPIGGRAVYRARAARTAPFSPAAQLIFRRTERVRLEWTASGPLDSRDARVLGADGAPRPTGVALSERVDGARAVLVADVSLASLAPGDYLLEVTATAGGQTVTDFVGFRVKP